MRYSQLYAKSSNGEFLQSKHSIHEVVKQRSPGAPILMLEAIQDSEETNKHFPRSTRAVSSRQFRIFKDHLYSSENKCISHWN